MKAATYKAYGAPEVVELSAVAKPIPKDNEVLIKIHATTVSAGDWRARSLDLPAGFGLIGRLVFGVFGPRNPILGGDLAGEIEAIGGQVRKFRVGGRVIATSAGFGTHAEYKALPEDGAIVPLPANLSFEEGAALCFGGVTALAFLRDKGNIAAGDKVLIVGASGAVGSAAVQLAKYFGAHVTGVSSQANLALVKSIGADEVIDYGAEDLTKNGEAYDIIVDTTGTAPWARSKASLRRSGRLLMVSGSLMDMIQSAFVSRKQGQKLVAGVAMGSADALRFLASCAERGDLKPLIDRSFPLEQIVEAHRYVDTGRKRGSVVVTVGHSDRMALAAE